MYPRFSKAVAFLLLSLFSLLQACAGPVSQNESAPAGVPAAGFALVATDLAAAPPTQLSLDSPALVSTAEPATVLLADDFTNTGSGWDVRHDPDAITDYQNGTFVIFVGKTDTTLWSKPNHYLTDVAVEVDTFEAAGPDDNLYGVICRYLDGDNFYRFVIAGNGYAGITKRANGQVTVLSGPTLTRSPAVNRGQAGNHIRAVCRGSELSLYVNSQLVAQATDGEFPGGDVGVLASAGTHPGIEIHFSHFVVTQP